LEYSAHTSQTLGSWLIETERWRSRFLAEERAEWAKFFGSDGRFWLKSKSTVAEQIAGNPVRLVSSR